MRWIARIALGCGLFLVLGVALLAIGVVRAFKHAGDDSAVIVSDPGDAAKRDDRGRAGTRAPLASERGGDGALGLDRQRLVALVRRAAVECGGRSCVVDGIVATGLANGSMTSQLRNVDVALVRGLEDAALTSFKRPRAADLPATPSPLRLDPTRCITFERGSGAIIGCARNDERGDAVFQLVRATNVTQLAPDASTPRD